MFQVLHSKVQTDKGKALVRLHTANLDAQKVFAALKIYGDKSISAKIKASDLLTYITSSKINDGTWRGTSTGYIRHWKEQVRLYHKKLDLKEHFSDSQKKTILENAISTIPELRQVKTNADTLTAFNGTALDFGAYDTLLESADVQYDASLSSKRNPNRTVYMSDISEDLIPQLDGTDEDIFYDIDSSLETIHANAANSRPQYNGHRSNNPRTFNHRPPRPPSTRLPADQWNQLSAEDKIAWNSLSQQCKAIIRSVKTPSSL